jgi:hypothetical protein
MRNDNGDPVEVVKIEGGTLHVEPHVDAKEVSLVASRDADGDGPALRINVIVGIDNAAVLHRKLGESIDEVRGSMPALERMRAKYESVFGDDNVPDWVRSSIARYVDDGIPTGDLMRAVLANDLQGAFARADIATAELMPAIVSWVYNRVPRNMCGNYAVVDSYVREQLEIRRRASEQGGAS